jgi:hypothetical protein
MSSSGPNTPFSRREWLALFGKTILAFPLLDLATMSTSCGGPSSSNTPAPPPLTDDQFLDDIERAIFLYFWEQASATTGHAVNIFRTRRSWTWQPRSTSASTGRGC